MNKMKKLLKECMRAIHISARLARIRAEQGNLPDINNAYAEELEGLISRCKRAIEEEDARSVLKHCGQDGDMEIKGIDSNPIS